MDGLYFDGSPEPNSFYYDLMKRCKARAKKRNQVFITPECKDAESYYNALLDMQKFTEENVKMYSISKEGDYEVITNPEVDIDDRNGPSIEFDAKKKSKKEKEALLKKKQMSENE